MAVKQILGKVTVTPKGEYSSGETYKRLDIVTSNGQSYIAKVDNTGVSVTDTNTWLQLVEKPEKGIDYFTEEDIAQLVSMVTDDSESEFNEYYNGKVSDFDSNASSKTSEFNSNYDEKVESFNTIFDTSTDNFDGNYETKLSAFNENASTQTSTFNSVVKQATSDFNSNASTLTETFNTNASEKTSAFNINASEKTQEFNDNVDEKTEQITSQLDNYVQFDNYPSNEKAGVVKSHINGFQVSNDGNPNAAILSKEQYDTIENQYFISKGTLENIKDDYVESSTPVKNLNTSLIDITPKNNAEGTDNTFDDGLESPLYALAGDGKSEQETTTGKNKLPNNAITSTINGISFTVNNDKSVTLNGTATAQADFSILSEQLNLEGEYTFSISDTGQTGVTLQYGVSGIGIMDTGTATTKYTTTFPNNSLGSEYSYINMCRVRVASGVTCNNYTIYPMIESGPTKTSYEPYTGGQPSPSPDYPQPRNSIEGSVEFVDRGKNLLANTYENKVMNGLTITKNNDGSVTINGTSTDTINYQFYGKPTISEQLPIYGNYISGGIQDVKINCINYNGTNYNILASNSSGFTKIDKSFYDKGYIELSIDANKTFNNKTIYPMLSNEQNVDWEPYIEPNKVTFNLNDEKLRSVGDVKDELVVDLDTGDYYKFKNVEHLELAIANMNNISEDYPGWINVEKINDYFPNANATINTLAKFKSNITTNGVAIGINTLEQSSLWLEKGKFNLTQTQWKQQYPDLIFKLDYVIPNTEKIKLGTLSAEDLAKLKTFKGYNNVTVNTNIGLMNIRFTYGLDIKKYIDNKIAELSAQLIKGE